MFIKDLREKKCKDEEVDLSNWLKQNLRAIPGIVNGLIQEGNNKVKPAKLNTNSRDCANLNVMMERRFSKNSVLITGDSHGRERSVRVKYKLNKTCHVTGIVKPGLVINSRPTTAIRE